MRASRLNAFAFAMALIVLIWALGLDLLDWKAPIGAYSLLVAVAFGAGAFAFRRDVETAVSALPPTEARQIEIAEIIEPETEPRPTIDCTQCFAKQKVDAAQAALDEFRLYVDLLTRQLSSVSEVTCDAAETTLSQLADVDRRISGLVLFIQQSGADRQSNLTLDAIENRFAECRALLADLDLLQKKSAANASSCRERLVDETRHVLTALDSVHRVARQTTMLSLNVSIEAARVGEAGKGFAVISEEIRVLAAEVQDLAVEIQNKVSALVNTISETLSDQAKEREHTENIAMANIGAAISSLSGHLGDLLRHYRDILGRVGAENELIAKPIMSLMGGMQFQDIVRQQIQHSTQMTAAVGRHMNALNGYLSDADKPAPRSLAGKLDRMFKSYVMEAQRRNHHAALNGDDDAPRASEAPRIELF